MLRVTHPGRHELLLALQSLLMSAGSVFIFVGLVASPTNCSCGTGTPHPHSLFILVGHHHTASGRHMRLGSAPMHQAMMEVAQMDRTPRLQALTGHGSDRIAMLALAASLGLSTFWRRVTLRYHDSWRPAAWLDRPDPPPPRLLPAPAL